MQKRARRRTLRTGRRSDTVPGRMSEDNSVGGDLTLNGSLGLRWLRWHGGQSVVCRRRRNGFRSPDVQFVASVQLALQFVRGSASLGRLYRGSLDRGLARERRFRLEISPRSLRRLEERLLKDGLLSCVRDQLHEVVWKDSAFPVETTLPPTLCVLLVQNVHYISDLQQPIKRQSYHHNQIRIIIFTISHL